MENFGALGRGCVNLNRVGRASRAKCLGGCREAHGNWPKAGLTELTKGVLAVLSVGVGGGRRRAGNSVRRAIREMSDAELMAMIEKQRHA